MASSSSNLLLKIINHTTANRDKKPDAKATLDRQKPTTQPMIDPKDSDSSDEEEYMNYLKNRDSDSSDEQEYEHYLRSKVLEKKILDPSPDNPHISIEMKTPEEQIQPEEKPAEEKLKHSLTQTPKSSKSLHLYLEKGNVYFSTTAAGIQGCMIILSIFSMFSKIDHQGNDFNPLYLLLAIPGGLALAGVTLQGILNHNYDSIDRLKKLNKTSQDAQKQAVSMLKLISQQEKNYHHLKKHATTTKSQLLQINTKNAKQRKTSIKTKLPSQDAKSQTYTPQPSAIEASNCTCATLSFSFVGASVNFLSNMSTIYVLGETAQTYLGYTTQALLPWKIAGVIAALFFNVRIFKDIEMGFKRYSKLTEDIAYFEKQNKKLFDKMLEVQKRIYGDDPAAETITKLEKKLAQCKILTDEIDTTAAIPPVNISSILVDPAELNFMNAKTKEELIHLLQYCYHWLSKFIDVTSAILGAASAHYSLYELMNQIDPDNKELRMALNIAISILGFLGCISTFKNILRNSNFGLFRFDFEPFTKDIVNLRFKTTKSVLKRANKLNIETLIRTDLLHTKLSEFLPIAKQLSAPLESKKLQTSLEIIQPKKTDETEPEPENALALR